jgi:hypothetical protein
MTNSRHSHEVERMDTEDSISPSHKRSATSDPNHRKNKGTKTMHGYKPRAYHYWYGFPVMDAIAAAGGPETSKLLIPELVELGWLENEAQDYYNGKTTFPRVTQYFWPHTRRDKRPGYWYHFTQIPSKVEVDPKIGFALVYNLLFHFEKPSSNYSNSDIISLTLSRLKSMNIELGDIVEPIAPFCRARGNKAWNGMIRIHLKNPS